MKKRLIADTEVAVSLLSLGTVKFGRNQSVKYPGTFDLPSDADLARLLDIAKQAGISTLDTAPAYGIAEERLGKLLKGQRQHWEIITKAGESYDVKHNTSHYDFSAKALRLSLENSLRKLQTDYIDCWMIHSDGNDIERLNDDVINILFKAKQEGLTRSIGMSTKTVAGGEYALQHLDCIMMAASLNHTEENTLFSVAEKLGKSVILKKIYDSGWALTGENKQQVMQQTLLALFQHKAVASAIVGTINPRHLQENSDAYLAAMGE
jgi:aryl-alcohol dehydrogenase-like predicted oxidoreductase